MNQNLQHFGIVGGGAWGTALALALLRAGRDVTLWAREKSVSDAINSTHENAVYLPDIKLDERLKATSDLAALAVCDALLIVTPVQHTRAICAQLAEVKFAAPVPLVICSKGVEQGTLELPSAMIKELLPQHPVAVLSGPTFAIEVAREQPTALTLACADAALGAALVQKISSRAFRTYQSEDVIGAQIGGAIKNVLAVACGVCSGRSMGDNARAALITRGLAEMMRLGVAMGGKAETLMGLSGLGDLVLTCSSTQSRNMSLGMALGKGEKLADILAARTSVAEGVHTAIAAAALAQKLNVEMPIVSAMDAILNRGAAVEETIAMLMARPLKVETR